MQKYHTLKVSRILTEYKERASSSIVHVCACMWVSLFVLPSRGQCYLLDHVSKSGTFPLGSMSWFVQCLYILLHDLIQDGCSKKRKWNYWCAAVIYGVSDFRLQILFVFNVQDLMGWAGNLRDKRGRDKETDRLYLNYETKHWILASHLTTLLNSSWYITSKVSGEVDNQCI